VSLVSVVLNFLDGERFLEEAVESVYAQSYTDWELLLIDDGSTDNSTEIARRYAARDPSRVRYLEFPGHENRGASAARNLGIYSSLGEFIAFLDCDDVLAPQCFERSVELLRRHADAGMVYGETEYWYSWGGDRAPLADRIQPHGFRANRVVCAPELLIRYLLHTAALPSLSSIMVRRCAAVASGGFVESFRGMHDDQAFLARFCLSHNVYVAHECWDRYRQHETSMCAVAAQRGEVASSQRVYLAWLREFLDEQGVRDTRVWDALCYAELVERYASRGILSRVGRLMLRALTLGRMWVRPRIKRLRSFKRFSST
jgi:glycosyltransferase involved in cell wall biosynthesis